MDFLPPNISHYTHAHTRQPGHTLQALDRYTNSSVLYPRMLSGHLQGRLLSMISHLVKPRHVLEIGTYTGYSAICLAEGLAVGGCVTSIDVNEEMLPIARRFIGEAGMQDKVKLLHGDARLLLPRLTQPWDIVFIDADKENYCTYYELLIPTLKPGSLLLADNVLWSGKVVDTKALASDKDTQGIHRFNQTVLADPRVENVLLPVRDGLMMVRVK